MDLLGINHSNGTLPSVVNFIQQKYSKGIKIVIELGNEEEFLNNAEGHVGYFMHLKSMLMDLGYVVINGDQNKLSHPLSRKVFLESGELNKAIKQELKNMSEPGSKIDRVKIIRIVGKYISLSIKFRVQTLTTMKARDEGMAKSIENNKPELVVVGAHHTIKLKNRFPDAQRIFLGYGPSHPLFFLDFQMIAPVLLYSITQDIKPSTLKIYSMRDFSEQNSV